MYSGSHGAPVMPLSSVIQEELPDDALLKTFRGGLHPERWGRYGDCFSLRVPRPVSLADFVFAFYTSPVFRVERLLLGLLAHSPSSDADARAVADGSATRFAAWYVAARSATQLLMSDRFERTRSWFRVTILPEGALLQFGSAVASRRGPDGSFTMGGGFHLLLQFHLQYSRILLRGAGKQLLRR